MFNLREYRQPTKRLPDYLPWAALIAPGVVLQKEAILQKTIAFRGPDMASSGAHELVTATASLNNALKRLGSGWSYFIEAQRFCSGEYPNSTWSNKAAWLVDTERREAFLSAGSHYESSYYLTFVWKMPTDGANKFQGLFYNDPEIHNKNKQNESDLEHFIKTVTDIIGIMKNVFVSVSELDDDQTLSYLHSTISTNRHDVKAPETPMYLDALLPDQAFTPGDIPLLGDSFIPTCTVVGFPATTLPGLLDELNYLNIEYRWVTRYICLDKEDAQKEITRYRKRWWAKRKNIFTMLKEEATQEESALIDNASVGKAADCDAALHGLANDMASYGHLTITITVWHRDRDEALRRISAVIKAVQSRGFTVMDESLNSKEAWFGSLPGHIYANVRRPIVSSLNLAHLMPLSAVWAGDAHNTHLLEKTGCPDPHIVCSTNGNTIFRLMLNVGDVGHTFVCGPTGAGKTTLLNTVALQWLKYPNAQVIIFDKNRGARCATMAAMGTMYEPGNSDAPIAFQPLASIDQEGERIWASKFIEIMLLAQNVALNPRIRKEIDKALESMASDHVDSRTMTTFCDMVQDNEIRDALRDYTLEGKYGQLFDANHDDLKDGFWEMFEMSHLMSMGEEAVIPALSYLFHRVEQRMDGRPTLLILDESWLFLKHPAFLDKLEDWLKTLRKRCVYVIFATQEPSDAVKSPILSTILMACKSKLFLADNAALTPEMYANYQKFGLSDTEIKIISQIQEKREYYYKSVKGCRVFDLELGPVALTFAGLSDDEDHVFMNEIANYKPKDEHAEALLKYKNVSWGVELLTDKGKVPEEVVEVEPELVED